MNASSKAVLLLLFVIPTFSLAQSPVVKPSGVCVIRNTAGEGYGGLVPFSASRKGIRIAILVDMAGAEIITVDRRNSIVDTITDDKAKSLFVTKKGINRDGFTRFPKISKDKKACMFEVDSGQLPSVGASKVSTSGTLIVHTASKTETIASGAIELKKDFEFSAGDIKLKVRNADVIKSKKGMDFAILSHDDRIGRLAGVKFFDSEGKEIEHQSFGFSTSRYKDVATYVRSYRIKRVVTGTITVKLDVWTNFVEHKVPFDVTVGIGGEASGDSIE